LVCLLGAVLLSGCATNDPEADAFFNRGWLWPKVLDQPAPKSPSVDDSSPPRR
jgi:hypothetical protein